MRNAALCLALLAGPATADVFGFETPSGNIDCSVGQEANFADISCTIHDRNGPPALPRPGNCGDDWGHTFELRDSGAARMLCQPRGRNFSWNEKAPYGVTGNFGDIRCHSSEKGLECSNRDGHGFFLSRARQKVF